MPAVAACTQAGANAWAHHADMIVLEFGDEAILDASSFTLQGRERRNARQAVARARRARYVITVRRLHEVEASEAAALRHAAARWRNGDTERGFSMSLVRLDPVRDPDAVVVTAYDGDVVVALHLLVPWGVSGLSLDLMRRAPHAASGVNELLIYTLMSQLEALGVDRVPLNFAVFREAIQRSQSGSSTLRGQLSLEHWVPA